MLPWIAGAEKAAEGRTSFPAPAVSRAPPPEALNAVQQGGRRRLPDARLPARRPPGTATAAAADDLLRQRGNRRALWRTRKGVFKGKGDLKRVELPGSLAETLNAPGAVGAVGAPGPAVRMHAVIRGGAVDAFGGITCESPAVFAVAQHLGAGSDSPGHQFAPAFAIFVRQDIVVAIGPEDQARIRGVSGEATATRGIDAAAAREFYPAAQVPHEGGEPKPTARAWTERFVEMALGLARSRSPGW